MDEQIAEKLYTNDDTPASVKHFLSSSPSSVLNTLTHMFGCLSRSGRNRPYCGQVSCRTCLSYIPYNNQFWMRKIWLGILELNCRLIWENWRKDKNMGLFFERFGNLFSILFDIASRPDQSQNHLRIFGNSVRFFRAWRSLFCSDSHYFIYDECFPMDALAFLSHNHSWSIISQELRSWFFLWNCPLFKLEQNLFQNRAGKI